MRSQVVSGWPAMSVHALDKDGGTLTCRRPLTRLSKNILMILFEGTIETVVFRLPKEARHFEATGPAPLAKNWLEGAKSSVELGGAVKLAAQEEVSCMG